MATRVRLARVLSRSFATAKSTLSPELQALDKAATKGPKLPLGNDPAAYHPTEHAVKDTNRWKWITMAFAVPVAAYGVLTAMNEHPHHPPPPDYPYLRRATRSPRFPWGDRDLIGTPADREAWKAEDSSE